MADSAFRRLNVDQYDEDQVVESDLYEPDPRGPSGVLAAAQEKASAVRELVQRGDLGQALSTSLREPAYGEGVDEAKNLSLESVLLVLNSSRSSDIPNLLSQLDEQAQVNLMKYLYKAMENLGDTSGNVVLGWHEKLVEKAGIGCILRVMTDRRRV